MESSAYGTVFKTKYTPTIRPANTVNLANREILRDKKRNRRRLEEKNTVNLAKNRANYHYHYYHYYYQYHEFESR